LNRRITSAAVLIAVSLRNFSAQNNHFATLSAWVLFIAYAIGACERHGVQFARVAAKSVRIAKMAILGSLVSLCDEIAANPRLASQTGMEIAPIYRARATLLYGLMSVYWLWAAEEGWQVKKHEDFLGSWIPRDFSGSNLWGEGAIPQFLAHYWFLSRTDASWRSEHEHLASLCAVVISRNLGHSHQDFPGPYFSFQDSAYPQFANFFGRGEDPLQGETARGTSFFAQGLLHLLVRANLKQTAKVLWPSFTHLGLMSFDPEHSWQYCLYRTEAGQQKMTQIPHGKAWSALVEESRNCRAPIVPTTLLSEKFIFMLFVLLLPYRATPEVIRFLGRRLGTVWFIPPPID
jgi:hypothetical protein